MLMQVSVYKKEDEKLKSDSHGFAILTKNNFEPAIKKDEIWVVVFSAVWCGPCQQLKKELSHIVGKGGVKFGVVDFDNDREIHERYNRVYVDKFRDKTSAKNERMGLPAMWIMHKGKALHVEFQKVLDNGYVKIDINEDRLFLSGKTDWLRFILDAKKGM